MFRCLHLILVTVIFLNFANSHPVIQNLTNCCCLCQQSCIPCPATPASTFSSCASICQNQQCCTPSFGVVAATPISTYQQPCVQQQPCIQQQPCTQQHQCIQPQPCIPPQPCLTQQPCIPQQPCLPQQPCISQQPCLTQQPCIPQQPVISQQPCLTQQPCIPQQPVILQQPFLPQQPCIPKQPTEEHTTKKPIVPVQTPPPKVKCPENTINVNNTCQPIFCGTGIYRNGVCIQTLCKRGTVWTGTECEIPQPNNHTTITILNTVNTSLNYGTNHTVNFNNEIDVFIPDFQITQTSRPSLRPRPRPRPRPSSCCTVVTPHTCLWDDSQYDCSSRSFQTCSSACSSSYVYLRPPSFMPPPPSSCENNDCYNGHRSFYPDCSNCIDESYGCWSYCRRRSICQVRQCQSIDMRVYCGQYPGSMGCREMDGCLDDWCHEY